MEGATRVALDASNRPYLIWKVAFSKPKLGEMDTASEELLALEGMDEHTAYILASRGVVTRDDLAELAVDEIIDIEGMDAEHAARLIMAARQHWFE